MKDILFLEIEDFIKINQKIINDYGGIFGLQDRSLLLNIARNAENLYFYKNATVYEVATGYAFEIIKHSPFLQANKKTGFAALGLFLYQNNIKLIFPPSPTNTIMNKIATGKIQPDEVVRWLVALSRE